jgi:hypothetical protein
MKFGGGVWSFGRRVGLTVTAVPVADQSDKVGFAERE